MLVLLEAEEHEQFLGFLYPQHNQERHAILRGITFQGDLHVENRLPGSNDLLLGLTGKPLEVPVGMEKSGLVRCRSQVMRQRLLLTFLFSVGRFRFMLILAGTGAVA